MENAKSFCDKCGVSIELEHLDECVFSTGLSRILCRVCSNKLETDGAKFFKYDIATGSKPISVANILETLTNLKRYREELVDRLDATEDLLAKLAEDLNRNSDAMQYHLDLLQSTMADHRKKQVS